MKHDDIYYNGETYRRYPEAKQTSHRRYYCGLKSLQTLHRAIWQNTYGEIPKGYHIHHKDGNWFNNDITNLECVSPQKHNAIHQTGVCSNATREHLDRIRPKAKDWHASQEGRAWHSDHSNFIWSNAKQKKLTCKVCGKDFLSWMSDACFCSNACCTKNRRNSGNDNETRTCVVCQTMFQSNRYCKTKTCSKVCASKLQKETKRLKREQL